MLQLVRDYGKEISWNVGSLFAHDRFLWSLVSVLEEFGYKNPISHVFGSTPCLFQGGRIAPRTAELKDAKRIIDKYNEKKIGCRLTYSNILIREEDLEDEICNEYLKYLNDNGKDAGNGVIVSSDMLAKYIKAKYSNLQLISSLVKPSIEVGLGSDEENAEYYNRLFDLYDIVSINPFKVKDSEFLYKIKYPNRVEFRANHRCVPNCPLAKEHYLVQMYASNKMLTGEDPEKDLIKLEYIDRECYKIKSTYPMAGTSLSESDIECLCRMGFTNLKIEGREHDGRCFIRDLGDYIFISYIYRRVADAIMKSCV